MKTRLTGRSTKTRTDGLAPGKANLPEVWLLQPMEDSKQTRGKRREVAAGRTCCQVQGRAFVVERVNGRLKDEFGGRFVRLRGAIKVKCHMMFSKLVLAVDQIFRIGAFRPAPA